jgi:hypothetical protein
VPATTPALNTSSQHAAVLPQHQQASTAQVSRQPRLESQAENGTQVSLQEAAQAVSKAVGGLPLLPCDPKLSVRAPWLPSLTVIAVAHLHGSAPENVRSVTAPLLGALRAGSRKVLLVAAAPASVDTGPAARAVEEVVTAANARATGSKSITVHVVFVTPDMLSQQSPQVSTAFLKAAQGLPPVGGILLPPKPLTPLPLALPAAEAAHRLATAMGSLPVLKLRQLDPTRPAPSCKRLLPGLTAVLIDPGRGPTSSQLSLGSQPLPQAPVASLVNRDLLAAAVRAGAAHLLLVIQAQVSALMLAAALESQAAAALAAVQQEAGVGGPLTLSVVLLTPAMLQHPVMVVEALQEACRGLPPLGHVVTLDTPLVAASQAATRQAARAPARPLAAPLHTAAPAARSLPHPAASVPGIAPAPPASAEAGTPAMLRVVMEAVREVLGLSEGQEPPPNTPLMAAGE